MSRVPKVLLAKSADFLAMTLVGCIQDWGYHAIPVYTPEEALEHVEIFHFDIAFVEVVMTGMGGVELAKQIYKKAPSCKIVLYVMAQSDFHEEIEDVVATVKSLGFPFDYIPCSENMLRDMVDMIEKIKNESESPALIALPTISKL